MLESLKSAINPEFVDRAIQGIDEKQHDAIQFLGGAYPEFVGLQKRLNGKTTQIKYDRAVQGIYTFYNYYGRRFNIIEFDDGFEISDPPKPPVTPLTFTSWYDDFEGYPDLYAIPFYDKGIWQVGDTIGFITYVDTRLSDDMESYAAGDIAASAMAFIETSIYAAMKMVWVGPWRETIIP